MVYPQSLFRNKVTIYHKEGKNIVRTVVHAFYEESDKEVTDKNGTRREAGFLAVIPFSALPDNVRIVPLDKIRVGEHGDISDWVSLNPSLSDVRVIRSVSRKYALNGRMTHIEVSG